MHDFALTAWREHAGLTQQALSRISGISRPNISAFERNRAKMTVGTLERIAKALNITPGTLLDTLPPQKQLNNRHDIDAVAHAIISGDRNLSANLNAIADHFAVEVRQLLVTYHAPGLKRIKRRRWDASCRRHQINRARYGKNFQEHLLKRVIKLLPL